jgi:uncharacterized protein (TIGR03435 family)
MKRTSITVYLNLALAGGLAASAAAQSTHARPPVTHLVAATEARPADRVHISPTAMQANAIALEKGSATWTARGYELKALIAEIYGVDERQVDLAEASDTNARYDLTVALPREIAPDEMQRLLSDAIAQKFSLDIKPEVRSMYVFAVMAPNGPGSGLRLHAGAGSADDGGEIKYAGRGCSGVAAEGVSVTGKTIAEFARTLEPDMDRLVVDETKLPGTYDFQIGKYSGQDELFRLLRDQLGLVVKPVERKVTVLRVRPHGEFSF